MDEQKEQELVEAVRELSKKIGRKSVGDVVFQWAAVIIPVLALASTWWLAMKALEYHRLTLKPYVTAYWDYEYHEVTAIPGIGIYVANAGLGAAIIEEWQVELKSKSGQWIKPDGREHYQRLLNEGLDGAATVPITDIVLLPFSPGEGVAPNYEALVVGVQGDSADSIPVERYLRDSLRIEIQVRVPLDLSHHVVRYPHHPRSP